MVVRFTTTTSKYSLLILKSKAPFVHSCKIDKISNSHHEQDQSAAMKKIPDKTFAQSNEISDHINFSVVKDEIQEKAPARNASNNVCHGVIIGTLPTNSKYEPYSNYSISEML